MKYVNKFNAASAPGCLLVTCFRCEHIIQVDLKCCLSGAKKSIRMHSRCAWLCYRTRRHVAFINCCLFLSKYVGQFILAKWEPYLYIKATGRRYGVNKFTGSYFILFFVQNKLNSIVANLWVTKIKNGKTSGCKDLLDRWYNLQTKQIGTRPRGRCDMWPSRIITDYHTNEVLPLMKCIRRYVYNWPVIILVLFQVTRSPFVKDVREKRFWHFHS